MTDVSIIFVNYKTKDLTINAIQSVIEKTHDIKYEIFVVDNNSQDGSIEAIATAYTDIKIIKSPQNGGFGYANNLAIKQAKGKYILCLNTDTLLINNAIKIMYDFMEREENRNIGACGGFLYNKNYESIKCGGMLPTPYNKLWILGLNKIFKEQYKNHSISINSDEKKYTKKLGYIIGADLFLRKCVLDEVGLFDENIFLYYEETDLCKRIQEHRYSIKFVPEAKIIHLEGGSAEANINTLKTSMTSEFYYFKKHYPNSIIFVKLIYIIKFSIGWYLLRRVHCRELLEFIINKGYEQKC